MHGFQQRNMIVRAVCACTKNQNETSGVQSKFPGNVVCAFLWGEVGTKEGGAQEKTAFVNPVEGHSKPACCKACFWNSTDKKVCLWVNPAFTEAIAPVKFSTAGDCLWGASRHGFSCKFKKSVVEVCVGAEDDVWFFSADDFLKSLLVMNHASLVKVGDFFKIVKI